MKDGLRYWNAPPEGVIDESRAALNDRRFSPRQPVNCPARIKALEPLTSTDSSSPAHVIQYSDNGIQLLAQHYLTIGTVVQLQVERKFSLWKVRHCLEDGDAFRLGLELAHPGHPLHDARRSADLRGLAFE